MKRFVVLILTVLVVFLAVVMGKRVFRDYADKQKARSHGYISELRGMYALCESLEYAAIADPEVFLEFVGAGIKTNATSIPDVVRSNLLYSPGTISHMYKDRFGNPLLISIVPESYDEGLAFGVKIWSAGANGRDDSGAADDRVICKTIKGRNGGVK